jgi:hypothetical protein
VPRKNYKRRVPRFSPDYFQIPFGGERQKMSVQTSSPDFIFQIPFGGERQKMSVQVFPRYFSRYF